MLKSIGAILLYIVIAIYQIKQLKKEKMKREIWIFSILMLLITVITVVKFSQIPLPSVLDPISIILSPVIKEPN